MEMVRVWLGCRDGNGHAHWPDGGAYLDQPEQLVTAWAIIQREWGKYDKER